ncbi:hypothetical protein GCM10027059_24740 [Myceligenerans halotolerans]
MSTEQHQSGREFGAAASGIIAKAHLRAHAARGAMDRASTRFTQRRGELRARLAARRQGLPDDAGLESIEVVVLSVVGLGIAIALGAAINTLVQSYMTQLGPGSGGGSGG